MWFYTCFRENRNGLFYFPADANSDCTINVQDDDPDTSVWKSRGVVFCCFYQDKYMLKIDPLATRTSHVTHTTLWLL